MAGERDYYQVLGVARTASPAELRTAHRRLVHVVHPDRQPHASPPERQLAERRMREINIAWHTLSNPTRKANYDRTLGPIEQPRASNGGAGRSRNSGAAARPGAGGPRSPQPPAQTTRRSANAAARPQSRTSPGGTGDRGSGTDRGKVVPGADSQDVHPGTLFLLRRGPIIAVVVIVLLLFIVTAYAGGGDDVEAPPVETCVTLVDGGKGVPVDCSLPNDGQVRAVVDAALDCPDGTRYAQVGPKFYCIPLNPASDGSG